MSTASPVTCFDWVGDDTNYRAASSLPYVTTASANSSS